MTTFDQPKEAGIDALTESIIRQAVSDYVYCVAFGFAPYSTMKAVNIVELEQFFNSPWFIQIAPTTIDGDAVIREMRRVAKRVRESRHRVRRKKGGYEIFDKNDPQEDLGLGLFKSLDEANRKAAELDGLQPWQYAIALYGKPKRNRG